MAEVKAVKVINMTQLKIGIQYIIKQGDRFLFDGVYKGNVRDQVYHFSGGPCCSLRLTAEDMSKLTFIPDPITGQSN
jgi:hypothetical protein